MSETSRAVAINKYGRVLSDLSYHHLAATWVADVAKKIEQAPASERSTIELGTTARFPDSEALRGRSKQEALGALIDDEFGKAGMSSINDLRGMPEEKILAFADSAAERQKETSKYLLGILDNLDLAPANDSYSPETATSAALEIASTVRPPGIQPKDIAPQAL